MKNQKGEQVFVDDVDILLTEKIVRHTKENAAEKIADPTAKVRTDSKDQPGNAGILKPPKTGLLKIVLGGSVIIAGLVAFFLCKKNCRCCRKK